MNEEDFGEITTLKSINRTLKQMVEEFKQKLHVVVQFTKLCDWGNNPVPEVLKELLSIQTVEGESILCEATGESYLTQGTKVDGLWHGMRIETSPLNGARFSVNMVQGKRQGPATWETKSDSSGVQHKWYWEDKEVGHIIQNSDDKSVMYHCTNDDRKGVSVFWLTTSTQSDAVFGVANGYQIRLKLFESVVQIREVVNGVRSDWVDYKPNSAF